MTLFVIGVNGQFGHDMMIELNKRGYRCMCSDVVLTYTGPIDFETALEYVPLDCGDRDAVKRVLKDISPTAVIDCAESSAIVEACEEFKIPCFHSADDIYRFLEEIPA